MKKQLIIPITALLLASCGDATTESSTENKPKITVQDPQEFTDLVEAYVDSVYLKFDDIEALDKSDVPESEFLAGVKSADELFNHIESELNRIEPFGKNPEPFLKSAHGVIEAARKHLDMFKRNATLLSKPDKEWTKDENDKLNTEYDNSFHALDDAMDELYDENANYHDAQPEDAYL